MDMHESPFPRTDGIDPFRTSGGIEPPEGRRHFGLGRVLFLIAVGVAALLITVYVLLSSWLAPEAAFGVSDRPIGVLLLGTDRTYDEDGEPMGGPTRADTIMLVSFNPRSNTSYLVSIPRDTRAVIPGHGVGKLNASHAYGGVELTRQAVEELTGMRVDRYAEADFQTFREIVDAIGGVRLDVEKDMRYEDRAGDFKVDIRKGEQVLDGAKALQYVRYRADALGDISRVARQQTLLKALLRQMLSVRNASRVREVVRVLREHVKTDMSLRDMASIGWFLVRTRGKIVTETLPGSFSAVYWLPDEKAIEGLVREMSTGFGE